MDDATCVPLSLLGFQRSLWEECELVINSSMASPWGFCSAAHTPDGHLLVVVFCTEGA